MTLTFDCARSSLGCSAGDCLDVTWNTAAVKEKKMMTSRLTYRRASRWVARPTVQRRHVSNHDAGFDRA
jgi:hypothetical protein